MKKIVSSTLLSLFLLLTLLFSPAIVDAATFRSGETVVVDTTLQDLYASGGTITITSPIRNDLTIAGGTITLNAPVSNGLLAAGGTININGPIGNTIRAAGGTITLSSPVRRDAVLFGGTITLNETASISGDLIVNGGTLNVQAPVTGNVIVNGGHVTINAPVGGDVQGNIGDLILGKEAVINGNLTYASENRAVLRDGAVIKGTEDFRKVERDHDNEKKIAGIVTAFSFYKLVTDILASLALIYMFYLLTRRVVERGTTDVLRHGLLGLATLIVGPILGVFLLVLLLPGVILLILYALFLLLAAYMSKLLVGWIVLRWWYGRNDDEYVLDWKAAVLGPILMFVLLLIPVLGWFVGFLFFLVGLGSLLTELFSNISGPTIMTRHTTSSPAKVIKGSSSTRRRSTKRG